MKFKIIFIVNKNDKLFRTSIMIVFFSLKMAPRPQTKNVFNIFFVSPPPHFSQKFEEDHVKITDRPRLSTKTKKKIFLILPRSENKFKLFSFQVSSFSKKKILFDVSTYDVILKHSIKHKNGRLLFWNM